MGISSDFETAPEQQSDAHPTAGAWIAERVAEADALPPVGGGPLDDLALAAGPQRVLVLVAGGGPLIMVDRRALDAGRAS